MPRPVRDVRLVAFAAPAGRETARRREDAARADGVRGEAERQATARAALESAAVALRERTEALEQSAEPRLVALVKAIAAEVLQRELEDGRYDLAAMVRACLSAARGVDRGATVRVHPLDYDAVSRTDGVANVVADASVERGGCRVETPYGCVARDLEAAVAAVFAAVDGRR
ncbi:MAG TPA: FliH/SctL family protein [Planctomycetota bacterium]|nr:FliH/SctL family protein [Planctomycetota bacterium]